MRLSCIFRFVVLFVGGTLPLCPAHKSFEEVAATFSWELFPSGRVPLRSHEDFHPRQPDNGTLYRNMWNQSEIANVTVPELVPVAPVGRSNGTSAIIVPGGAYKVLAWQSEGIDVAKWLASVGVAAFVLKYRVPDRGEDSEFGKLALVDGQRAVSLVRSRAAALGLDPYRIGVVGFSAGGHLGSMLSRHTSPVYSWVDSVDDYSFRPDWVVLAYPAFLAHNALGVSKNKTGKLSTISQPTPLIFHPPCFLVAAWDDSIIPAEDTVAYALSLRSAGAPSPELNMFAAGGHGFGYCDSEFDEREVCIWPQRAERWLQGMGLVAVTTKQFGDPSTQSPWANFHVFAFMGFTAGVVGTAAYVWASRKPGRPCSAGDPMDSSEENGGVRLLKKPCNTQPNNDMTC